MELQQPCVQTSNQTDEHTLIHIQLCQDNSQSHDTDPTLFID